MSQRARRPAKPPAGSRSTPNTARPALVPPGRECPWCGSKNTVFVQRGLTSAVVSPDQYLRCNDCARVTYEIVSRNDREIRLGRYQTGGDFRDATHQTRYRIYRMLKVGFNEYLLYLRPITPDAEESQ